MPCAVTTMSSSPIFTQSPRKLSPIFCKPATSPPPPSLSSPTFTLKNIRKPLNIGEEAEVDSSKVPAVLKRKRPARINIPVASLGFDDIKSISDVDRSSEVEFEGESYSVYCKKGKRGGFMEDRYAAVLGLQGDSKQAFFGVFDGHGGAEAADFAAKNLEKNVMNEVSKRSEEIEEAVKEGYISTDSKFLKEDIGGGTCCVTALIHKGDLVVSNAGDCRAVLSRGGIAEALTVDHRPSLDEERERIESLGGYVDCCRGVWRVHGSLAVSRAIGDRHLKQWVIAEPETKVFEINPECEFLILASDGLWDNVSNQEAVDVVRSLCIGVDKPAAFSACKKLVDLSLTRGSLDDISVMVIQLTQFIQ
ncbi:Serine/threonine protein phosphatase [Handroanthus impetiginosus]|uniref:protein-serine/threonine phosphatase n=1 Tax=Handroanthus impetiginosus TaxID=429701 RepID=A0A2G9G257_9LAMI|nr:Serine/threonine protein phosphatase [Handroanthus impetiginosus]